MTGDAPAFVDTNVLIYAFEKPSSDRKVRAKELVARLLETGTIRFSTQVFQEFFVILTRKGSQPCSAEETLSFLDDFATFPFVAVDYELIREAILLSKEAVVSFWDALIVMAAVRSGALILYTEDLNHGQWIRGVQIINPFRDSLLLPLA